MLHSRVEIILRFFRFGKLLHGFFRPEHDSHVTRCTYLRPFFVRTLFHDLETGSDQRADVNFNLEVTAVVVMHGVRGRTVPKLRMFDLHVVKRLSPDIIILEKGTNDLTRNGREVVGSEIDDFVRFLLDNLTIHVVGVCYVRLRVFSCVTSETSFLTRANALEQYTSAVLGDLPNVFCWLHYPFSSLGKDFYIDDGVHLNSVGQYQLYRSYRSAILRAIGML